MTIIIAFSCGGGKTEITGADKYIDTITVFTCEKAAITDNGYLVIAIDVDSDSGYDMLASLFLKEAKKRRCIRAKRSIDRGYKNAKFEQGSVVGKRLEKLTNKPGKSHPGCSYRYLVFVFLFLFV